jgi:hypothetical protein
VQHGAVCARALGKKALEDLAAGGTVQKKQTEIVKPRALYFSAELIKVEAMEDTDIARVGSQIVLRLCLPRPEKLESTAHDDGSASVFVQFLTQTAV